MVQTVGSISTSAHRPSRKPQKRVTEAARFLLQFYQQDATQRALKIPGLDPEMPNDHGEMSEDDGGSALPSPSRRKDPELQAKDLNQRQHPRDMPIITLEKDTGESETIWDPSEEEERHQRGQDVKELEEKARNRHQRGQDVKELEEKVREIKLTPASSPTSPAFNSSTDQRKENVQT
ncbi:MAG: hypothetical protein Q9221_008270 [Calogaya cf. arnoldii]